MLSDNVIDGVSLIVATLGEHDIHPLLDSLEAQSCDKYECIIVDQSKERDIEYIVKGYRNTKYLHSSRKGNSYNRNLGIKRAQMPILGFPDDDCFYNTDVIEKVLQVLSLHPDMAGVSGSWMDTLTGNLVMGGSKNKYTNYFNIWGSVTNLTIFLRSEAVRNVHGYDENFGLGSNVFEGGEETDFILKILEKEGAILYYPDIKIWHRQNSHALINLQKQLGYEESWGALFRKWSFRDKKRLDVFLAFLYFLIRSLIGSVLWALRGNFKIAKFYLMKNKARLQGWKKYGSLKCSLRNNE
jgi:glycosyltransferase involved in cell wall biosynthesis